MRVALYARVSTDEQTEQNQVVVLEKWAEARGFEVYGIYHDTGSAYQGGDLVELKRMLVDAHLGKFKKIIVWSLDRLTRRGANALGNLLEQVETYGVHVLSMQQDWTDVPDALYPLLVSIYGFWGKYESQMISARTKLGMARAKASGKHVGRPKKRGVNNSTPLLSAESEKVEC